MPIETILKILKMISIGISTYAGGVPASSSFYLVSRDDVGLETSFYAGLGRNANWNNL